MEDLTRRKALKAVAVGGVGLVAGVGYANILRPQAAQASTGKYPETIYEDKWPTVQMFPENKPQFDRNLVKKFVIAAHANLPVVMEMLTEHPTLINATWDWGNGDFERALEGAGHMGRADIAEYLLANGARMNLFCAAMLGHLELVKATLDAHPNLKDSKGPHGLTLKHHAKAGKERSKAVLDYIEKLG